MIEQLTRRDALPEAEWKGLCWRDILFEIRTDSAEEARQLGSLTENEEKYSMGVYDDFAKDKLMHSRLATALGAADLYQKCSRVRSGDGANAECSLASEIIDDRIWRPVADIGENFVYGAEAVKKLQTLKVLNRICGDEKAAYIADCCMRCKTRMVDGRTIVTDIKIVYDKNLIQEAEHRLSQKSSQERKDILKQYGDSLSKFKYIDGNFFDTLALMNGSGIEYALCDVVSSSKTKSINEKTGKLLRGEFGIQTGVQKLYSVDEWRILKKNNSTRKNFSFDRPEEKKLELKDFNPSMEELSQEEARLVESLGKEYVSMKDLDQDRVKNSEIRYRIIQLAFDINNVAGKKLDENADILNERLGRLERDYILSDEGLALIDRIKKKEKNVDEKLKLERAKECFENYRKLIPDYIRLLKGRLNYEHMNGNADLAAYINLNNLEKRETAYRKGYEARAEERSKKKKSIAVKAKKNEIDLSDMPLFRREPSIEDVLQGDAGDCYLCAGITALIKQDPKYIRDMMYDDGQGHVVVRLYESPGKPVYITLKKSMVYATILGDGDLSEGDFTHLANRAYKDKRGFWLFFLEKAYAMSGFGEDGNFSASSIDKGGESHQAMMHLTGRDGQKIESLTYADQGWATEKFKCSELAKDLMGDSEEERIILTAVKDYLDNEIRNRYFSNIGEDGYRFGLTGNNRRRNITIDDVTDTIKQMRYWQGGNVMEEIKAELRRQHRRLGNGEINSLIEKVAQDIRQVNIDRNIANGTALDFRFDPGKLSEPVLAAELNHYYSHRALETYRNITERLANRECICVGSRKYAAANSEGVNGEAMNDNMAEGHGYTIVRTEYDQMTGRPMLVLINPWGEKNMTYRTERDEEGNEVSYRAKNVKGGLEFRLELNDFMRYMCNIYTLGARQG